MSGTRSAPAERYVQRLQQVIFREQAVPIGSLLYAAIGTSTSRDYANLTSCAVCLDTNLLIKVLANAKRDQFIDYFQGRHEGPLIVSAQTLQEFWKNYHNALETVSRDIEGKLSALTQSLTALDGVFDEYKKRIVSVIDDFKQENEHVFSKDMERYVLNFLNVLLEKGLEAQAPRRAFFAAAAQRRASKTPPGFKDKEYAEGDLFVWLDFLYGMLIACDDVRYAGKISKAIFVTEDRKIDWVKGREAHPVLAAEVEALVGIPLEIWSLSELFSALSDSTSR